MKRRRSSRFFFQRVDATHTWSSLLSVAAVNTAMKDDRTKITQREIPYILLTTHIYFCFVFFLDLSFLISSRDLFVSNNYNKRHITLVYVCAHIKIDVCQQQKCEKKKVR